MREKLHLKKFFGKTLENLLTYYALCDIMMTTKADDSRLSLTTTVNDRLLNILII